jgi:hypothetical protein
MKKLLVGCLVTGLLLLIAGGGAAYWFIWRPIQQAHQAELQARPFTPNVEGLLTQDQVTKYLVVQNAMYLKLGTNFERIKKKYAEKSAQTDSQSASVGMGDVLSAYQEFATLKNDVKQARTESLNGQKISMAEYTWIHTQVNSAMKVMALGALGDAQKAMTPEAWP